MSKKELEKLTQELRKMYNYLTYFEIIKREVKKEYINLAKEGK